MMKAANISDIAIAQEWLETLAQWLDSQDLAASDNPKVHAAAALARWRHFQLTGETALTEHARQSLAWLEKRVEADFHTALLAGQAHWTAFSTGGEAPNLEVAQSATAFLARCERLEKEGSFSGCPGLNAYAAALVGAMGNYLEREDLREKAARALVYTLETQAEDGAWSRPDASTHLAHQKLGGLLRGLFACRPHLPSEALDTALDKGFQHYLKLFQRRRVPVDSTQGALFPVRIENCAEAVLCLSTLAPQFNSAERTAIGTLRWSFARMQDKSAPGPLYAQKTKWTRKKSDEPALHGACMYRAVAEYLHYFCIHKG